MNKDSLKLKSTLLILTLNELGGMKQLLPQIDKAWVDQILLIDGGSTDGTVEYAKKMGLEVVTQERKGLRFGYSEALPHIKGDYIIAFSPDGNSPVENIPVIAKEYETGNYDMLVLSRYLGDAKSEDDTLVTTFGNWLFRTVINLFYRRKYTDAMVMYRAFDKNLMHKLDLMKESAYWPEKIAFTTCCIMPLLSMRAGTAKLRTGEIPGDEPARIAGDAKLQVVRWGLTYMFQALTDWIWWRPSKG